MIVCHRNTVRESSHISFFCGRDPFCEVVQQPENIHKELTDLLERPTGLCLRLRDQRTSPLCLSNHWISDISQKLQTLYSLSSLKRKYEHFLCLTYFLLAGYWNLHTSGGPPPVIRWSYLWIEISVTQSIGNKLYSSPSSFPVTHFVDVILQPHWTC